MTLASATSLRASRPVNPPSNAGCSSKNRLPRGFPPLTGHLV